LYPSFKVMDRISYCWCYATADAVSRQSAAGARLPCGEYAHVVTVV